MSNTSESIDRQQVLKRAFLEIKEMRSRLDAVERARIEPIAIIGIGCRFPGGADGPEAFWQLLHAGRDAISEVPAGRWDADTFYDPDPAAPGKTYTRHGGFLAQVDQFDALFFDITPREAVSMDPQQRLLLEVSWEALENAGLAPDRLAGSRTGVFVGITANDYAQLCMKLGDLANIDAYVGTGNPFNFAAGRLSYILGLQGPCMAVDTACSSSLTAVHLACQSLRARGCDLALAGGVNLTLLPEVTITLSKARMLAADGRCKTFDAAADGYGRGEGCGVVVLKRLSDALADGDPILAVVRGTAANQNGPSSGITVPSAQAQQALIREALADAGIAPEQVSYVEAHGTGTALGDPIEVRALAAVLGPGRPAGQPLALGSVKTNIGHLEAAAGIAGLIKVVLAMRHRLLPPHLHLKQLNPYVAWETLPVTIPTRPTPWHAGAGRRIAGVSAFGVSGTNAHVVLEEAPDQEPPPAGDDPPAHLLTLSAKRAEALRELAGRFAGYLAANPGVALADICFTTHVGRARLLHRLAVVADSPAHMRDQLAAFAAGTEQTGIASGHVRGTGRPRVAFLFTGQGSQYAGMGRQLYETLPAFRDAMDRCAELLRPHLGLDLRAVLYPDHRPPTTDHRPPTTDHRRDTETRRHGDTEISGFDVPPNTQHPTPNTLDQTWLAQPAMFALEYALAEVWRSWGIEPAVVLGHSVGEYVAACLAGVFSLEDGLKLIAARGRLMQELPGDGAMAAVFADAERVAAAVAPYRDTVAIAAINSPAETVISGAREDVQALLAGLRAQGITTRPLTVSYAFHSPLMEPMMAAFARTAAEVRYAAPRLALVSNLSGRLVSGDEVASAEYWCRHVRETVQFAAGMQTLHALGCKAWVEVGPRPTLLKLARRCLPEADVAALPSMRQRRGEWQQLLESLGALYVQGVEIDWEGYERGSARRRVALPTYPWQRERYWIAAAPPEHGEPGVYRRASAQSRAQHPLLGQRLASPLKQIQFESQLSVGSVPLIEEHRIYGMFVVPGVVYLEMAMAAMQEVFGADAPILEHLALLQPLVLLADDARAVQLILTPDDVGPAQFQIFSQAPGEDGAGTSWRLHASGRLCIEPSDRQSAVQAQVALEEMQARCREELSGAEFYATIWNQEFQLGPSFRCIEKLWRRDGEALGRMCLPKPLAPRDRAHQVRPDLLMLDACVQLLMAALPRDTGQASALDVYVGTGEEFSRVYGPISDAGLWCQAVLRSSDKETVAGDICVFAESGQLVAELVGVRFKRVARETLQRMVRRSAAPGSEKGSLSRVKLRAAEPGEQRRMLEVYLSEEVAKVLGLPPSRLDREQSVVSLADSLMIVDLKNRIETDLGMSVPVALFFESDSIAQLATLLLDRLAAEVPALPVSIEGADSEELAELLAELEQLSEDEARVRLAAERAIG